MKQSILSTQPITLAEVQQQFKQWRATKAPGQPIPEALWAGVAHLLANTPSKRSLIGRGLGISTHQLRTHFPTYFKSQTTPLPKKPKPFVQAPLKVLLHPAPQLMVEHANGNKFTFQSITDNQWTALLKTLIA